MKLSDKIREKVRSYLRIENPQAITVNIDQLGDFDVETFVNLVWCRGKANEIEQLYHQMRNHVTNTYFWGSTPTQGSKIRKIHTGLPGLIVDVLTNVCTDDLNTIKLSKRQEEWDSIYEENELKELISTAVSDVLALGDGAFKLSYDKSISDLPIIEFFPANRVDYEYVRGRIKTIIFKTDKVVKGKNYTLKELYSKNSIRYALEDEQGKEISLSEFDEFADCIPVSWGSNFIAAVPLMFRKSKTYRGRGKSIFDGKIPAFDSFDEVYSQWMLAVRKGQIKTYIPEMFLPRDPETGRLMPTNDFDNDYVALGSDMAEGGTNKIETTQGEIQYEALLSSYCTALDLCLQGVISPSTLGIDIKKLDNADAQREKEKTTLYTRNIVVSKLTKALKQLVKVTLAFNDCLNNTESKEKVDVTVNFGGYANPSFEANVETVGKAATTGIMSVETQVEELYGDSKEEEWKKKEVQRIKFEKGIETGLSEPAVNNNPTGIDVNG